MSAKDKEEDIGRNIEGVSMIHDFYMFNVT